MEKSTRSAARAFGVMALLFALSVVIRRPLFNHEFTQSWEWLAAHTLLTDQLLDETPASVHHFNLLYTFPDAQSKFIDDLWQSGVVDAAGDYYYVSMPQLAFLTPYFGLKILHLPLTIAGLQVFTLFWHFLACVMLYVLCRRLTRGYAASMFAALAGFTVLLFAPTALFFYQNAVVGTVLVIPYTIGVLIAITALTQADVSASTRRIAWIVLFVCLLLGCLTDWQAYFTAFATAVVVTFSAWRGRIDRRTASVIVLVCCASVALGVGFIALQDARIEGFHAFLHTILGRFRVRSGVSAKAGLGMLTLGYYKNLARFYAAYAPFLLLSLILIVAVRRRREKDEIRQRVLARSGLVLIISTLAVVVDHVVLANHTAQQSFTTINSLVPIGILTATAVLAMMETSNNRKRDGRIVFVALTLCVALSVAAYYKAYLNRPHPFATAARQIDAQVKSGDVLFATGADFEMPSDYMIPQMLFYVRHNVQVVPGKRGAEEFLACRSLHRGLLVHLTEGYVVRDTEPVATDTVCLATQGAAR